MPAVAAATYPKEMRLRRRREFLVVQGEGTRWHSSHFTVVQRPSAVGRARVGITVSRRVGNAVVRNRLKRLIREFLRTGKGRLAPAHDIVVIAKVGANKLDYAQVAKELGRVLDRSGNAA
jgi:ribonuclease P protein component